VSKYPPPSCPAAAATQSVNPSLHDALPISVGIMKDSLMVRIDPELYDSSLKKKGVRQMDFTGKVLKGFLLVDPIGIDMDKDLEYWIQRCLDFNPKAKSSKKTESRKKASPPKRKPINKKA